MGCFWTDNTLADEDCASVALAPVFNFQAWNAPELQYWAFTAPSGRWPGVLDGDPSDTLWQSLPSQTIVLNTSTPNYTWTFPATSIARAVPPGVNIANLGSSFIFSLTGDPFESVVEVCAPINVTVTIKDSTGTTIFTESFTDPDTGIVALFDHTTPISGQVLLGKAVPAFSGPATVTIEVQFLANATGYPRPVPSAITLTELDFYLSFGQMEEGD